MLTAVLRVLMDELYTVEQGMQYPLANIFDLCKNTATMKITTAHRLYMKQVEARKTKVRKLRQLGMTWKAIGLSMGITHQRAQQLGIPKKQA